MRAPKVTAWIFVVGLGAANAFADPASIDLPGARVFPENLTSTQDGTLYVGSLGSGGILRIKPHDGEPQLWIRPGAFGSRSIFGVLADERSNTLWVCSNDLSALGVVIAGTQTGSSLKGFDLKTGQGKVSARLPGDHALCNDIAIGADGSAFVTNTAAPQILRLPPGSDQLEVWATDPLLAPPVGGAGLDGIAFGGDGNLYVDTYSPGELFRVDVVDGKAAKVTKLKPSRPLVLADAIRPLGSNAFLIVEGAGRLDRMRIQGDEALIETLKDGYATPTGVAVVGHTAWVSEGQLSYVFDPTKKSESPNLPFHLYSVGLPGHSSSRGRLEHTTPAAPATQCAHNDTGITLSPGFCAIIDARGNLFVDLGSATNVCEEKNRTPSSALHRQTRGGIWRYDANALNQQFSTAGSWNRAPAPQGGYNVVFQPLVHGASSGPYIVFADGFAGAIREPGRAKFRPTGLASGPDGTLYIADDSHGRIWRITYQGEGDAQLTAAPAVKTQSNSNVAATPPEGIHPDAGTRAPLPVPPGATADQVSLGERIFHGEVSNGTCAGCHGSDARGSPIGADLTNGTWLWSDGSLAGLTKSISEGVSTPKQHLGAMPPMGGSALSEADLQAVTAYVWSMGHQPGEK